MFEATRLNKKNLAKQNGFRLMLGTMTGILILPVILILGTLIYKGGPMISFRIFVCQPDQRHDRGRYFSGLAGNSAAGHVVALLASVPLGVAAAIYLSEYAPDNWFTRAINLAIINLAGVPSIVHALFGVGAFVIFFKFGTSILAASLTLAIMTLTGSDRSHSGVPAGCADGFQGGLLEHGRDPLADHSTCGICPMRLPAYLPA